MSIKPDFLLRKWAKNGGVNPLYEATINPASIDLRLGSRIRVPRWYWRHPLMSRLAWFILGKPDIKENPLLYWSEEITFARYILWPGQFVLCHSLETTRIPDDHAALLLSKSTTGRMGLEHLHAGYGDPGFHAPWTWELVNLAPWPIELIAGQRLAQLVLLRLEAPPLKTYEKTGRYQGQRGPTTARVETDYAGGKVTVK